MNLKFLLKMKGVWLIPLILCVITVQSFAQTRAISGRVTDAGNGDPVVGAAIKVKGTDIGTATDDSGSFQLLNTPSNAILVVSFIGYNPQEIAVGDQQSIVVSLEPLVDQLDEVVVVGYGTQKKATLTG